MSRVRPRPQLNAALDHLCGQLLDVGRQIVPHLIVCFVDFLSFVNVYQAKSDSADVFLS